jgi:plasmid stabilization system protein ParE
LHQAENFPNLGRPSTRAAGRRELVFSPLPYIVVYQVTQDAVEIRVSFMARRIGRSVDAVRNSPAPLYNAGIIIGGWF